MFYLWLPKPCRSKLHVGVNLEARGRDIFSLGLAHLVYLHSCFGAIFSVKRIMLQPIKATFYM